MPNLRIFSSCMCRSEIVEEVCTLNLFCLQKMAIAFSLSKTFRQTIYFISFSFALTSLTSSTFCYFSNFFRVFLWLSLYVPHEENIHRMENIKHFMAISTKNWEESIIAFIVLPWIRHWYIYTPSLLVLFLLSIRR